MISAQWKSIDDEARSGKRILLLCEWNKFAAPHVRGNTQVCIGWWSGGGMKFESSVAEKASLDILLYDTLPMEDI